MIIKNIAKLCRESRYLAIHQAADGVQWIGNGHAFYAVPSLPQMTFDQACAAFDYNDKVKKNIIEGKNETNNNYFILSDNFPFETYIEEAPEDISMNGRSFKMFRCAGRVFFINSEFLLPVADISEKMYYMRYVGDMPLLCVKRGLLIVAVIHPSIISQKEIEDFCGKLSMTVSRLTNEYKTPNSSDDDDQIKL